jgi:hypothetical protein
MRMADVALPGIRHAQRAVDEVFDDSIGRHGGAHLGDLADGQLACQYQLREADVCEEACLLRGADVALRGGMQRDRRQVQLQQPHVLHDERIHTGVVAVVSQLPRGIQLGIVQDGVERDEYARVIAVRIFYQCGDVADGVACLVACAERGAADIHRVRTMQDGIPSDGGSLGGGEQF